MQGIVSAVGLVRKSLVPGAALLLALAAGEGRAAVEGTGRVRALPRGLALETGLASGRDVARLFPALPESPEWPTVALRLVVRWGEVDTGTASWNWSDFDRALLEADDRGAPVVVVLTGPGPGGGGAPAVQPAALVEGQPATSSADTPELARWLAFVTAVVERGAGRPAAFSFWDHANDPASWGRPPSVRDHAYFLKRTALAVKAVDPGAFVASGSLVASVSYQRELFEEGVGPFLDAHGADLSRLSDADAAATSRGLEQLLLEMDPSSALWTSGRTLDGPDVALSLWRAALQAREHEVGLAAFTAGAWDEAVSSDVSLVLAAHARAFPPDSTIAPTVGRELVDFPPAPATAVRREIVGSDLSWRVAWRALETPAAGAYVDVRIHAPNAQGFRIVDPTLQWEGPVRGVTRNGTRGWIVRLPLADRPLVLAFERPEEAEEPASEEDVAVQAEAVESVEEILARHLEAQAALDRRVETLQADMTTELWYQLGASGRALEVRIEGRYYEDDAGRKDVENLRYFLNGAPLKAGRKGLPEIPLLQPEKVTVVPLDVHLDKSYTYRLVRKDVLRGRPAWVVDFEPVAADATRAAGTVWIDALTWQRLKVASVQTNLEAPVLSSEQEDFYEPVTAGDGATYPLIAESEIQRTVSILGANVVVRMKMRFAGHRVNEAGFDAAREEAYASEHQMLRDTDEGFQYLRKLPDGTREAGPTNPRKIAWAAGARYDSSYGGVIPLGGFNYLNWDVGGTGLQMNAFVAGAFNTLSFSDPSLWGSRLEGSVDVSLPLVQRRDQLRLPGKEIDDEETVKSRDPSVTMGLGVPVGRFGKFGLGLEVGYEQWNDDDDTADDFEAPESTAVAAFGISGEFHRAGWDVRVVARRFHRADWEPWGPGGGTEAEDYYEEGDQDYWRWRAGLAKRWFLPKFQAVSLGLEWFGGEGLDRFSQYEFGGFGSPDVPGFGGSGIHFNDAAVLRATYGVDVAGVFGLDLQLGYAKVRNTELPSALEDEFGEWGDALGIAVVGTIPGPARSVILFDVGYAIHASDHEDAEGGLVAQVLFTKIVR